MADGGGLFIGGRSFCSLCAWRAAQIFGEEAVWLRAIDAFLYSSVAGILPNWLLEWGALCWWLYRRWGN
ncbi:MAG: hypothetical protein M5U34_41810 [Chloroflexi bacterium]|nr:hypothetical protein [Chloroflexota bacterium]